MSKHILSNVKGFMKRGKESFFVDPACIKVVEGWNKRIDFTGEEDLMAYIKESGLPQPLLVKKTATNELELIDGERRLRAVLRLMKEGLEIQSIPINVAPRGMSEVDLCLKAVALNNGKPLSPIEQAGFFHQLESYGLSRQEIANKTGCSLSTVRNRLELNGAIPAVKKAVINNDISIKDAKKIIDSSDGKIEKQVEKLEVAKTTPKVRMVTVEYKKYEFCKAHKCGALSVGNGKCQFGAKSCPFTAKELHKWLTNKGFKITKQVQK